MSKKIWFQVHWLLGITAGVVLAVMGVTGAMLSFEEELLHLLNSDIMTVSPRTEGVLPPQELLARIQATYPQKRILGLNLFSDPSEAASVGFALEGGGQEKRGGRGEWRYVDPYTGVLLGEAKGREFFRFVTELHRWLAAGEVGKTVTGASTLALLVLSLSGLYLRWPRKIWNWRIWFTFKWRLSGRSFLWHLHAIGGTWVLLFYLIAGLTGLYWSYEWYRNGLVALAGAQLPNREGTPLDAPATAPPDLTAVWSTFLREAGQFQTVNLTLPQKPTQALEIRYLGVYPPHERAFNQLTLHPVSGAVIRHTRYAERSLGAKLVQSIFVLHSGSFFGLPGLLLMLIASLTMPVFAVTGWMLYLNRRAKKQAVQTMATLVRSTPRNVERQSSD